MLTEILGGITFVLLVALISAIAYYSRKVSQLAKKAYEAQAQAQQMAQQQAQQMFQAWVQQYSQQLRQQMEQAIRQQYEAQLQAWKQQHEQEIRRDAIARSVNTILGKIGEEFAPLFLAYKYGVNPKDFRHLGSPVDYIAFKGLSDENVEPEVIFIEVKSGKSSGLTERERKVRDAVRNGRVRYEVVNLNDLIGELQRRLREELENSGSGQGIM